MADLRFCEREGVAMPVGVPVCEKMGWSTQAFSYSSFLKDGGPFITYMRCTIKEKNMQVKLIM